MIGAGKADFTSIYTRPDPRAYVTTLTGLGYQIPQRAWPVVETVLAAATATRGPPPVLDLCCSYGINAALLRCGIDLDTLAARYAAPAVAGLSPDELVTADRAFYAEHLHRPDLAVLGLDASAPAIDYARRAGLLAGGWAEDLERGEPSRSLAGGAADAGLIVCTGGVGYVGRRTFERVLALLSRPNELWVVSFVLRAVRYHPIAECLARHGLVTERLPGATFPQRRFVDAAEQEAANRDVALRGLDPAGREAEGWYHADCFLSRPAAVAARMPIEQLFGELHGPMLWLHRSRFSGS